MVINQKILYITPPFTQLNTPYPATAYLKGYTNTLGVESYQADLGIEVILALFCKSGLQNMFRRLEESDVELSDNTWEIYQLRQNYLRTIDPVIAFLQHRDPTLAHQICAGGYLPEAGRFEQMADLEFAFGEMGITERARHLATLYLEDLSDLIKEAIDPHFGFSRYAERLSVSASDFGPLDQVLQDPDSLVSEMLVSLLQEKIEASKATVVCLTVPFPGNLFGALKCGQYIKSEYPYISVILGGGYANTELRSLADERLFSYVDFVCLDDGEAPLRLLLEHLEGEREASELKRVFRLHGEVVQYCNAAKELDVAQRETGTPDYSDLLLDRYLSVIEVVNPMHRLWSDGRWNKLTLAHGCYWGKCAFCDVNLDYIGRYEPISAAMLCDRIEEIIEQTGQRGFHFVDEAAPPALMRDLALEIVRRGITITWWTNIRFEKSFSRDLCRILKQSGCIAVSGGLEVASDRLLALMQKGVTVSQVAEVCHHFMCSNIMVHAYLMYGFPTQTEQETVDSLEMVRQLFAAELLQSGFWHLFAMTAHSPVGVDPAAYNVIKIGPAQGAFANNDLIHEDPEGAEHEKFSFGLRKSLFNFMNGQYLDAHLQDWFDFEVPETSVEPDFIANVLDDCYFAPDTFSDHARVVWQGHSYTVEEITGQNRLVNLVFNFYHQSEIADLTVDLHCGDWMIKIMEESSVYNGQKFTFAQLRRSFEEAEIAEWEDFAGSELWENWQQLGLLIL